MKRPSLSPVDRILRKENVRNNPLVNLSKQTRGHTKKLLLGMVITLGAGAVGGTHFISKAETNILVACQQMVKGEALDKAEYEPIFWQEDGPRFGLASNHYVSLFPKPFHELDPNYAALVANYCNTHYAWDSTPELVKAVTTEDVRKAVKGL